MLNDRRVHALLPWYVQGTLGEGEAESFRAHLADCKECREEMTVLVEIREQATRHGSEFFADHPSAEDLVALAGGHLSEQDTARVRRHVALCGTCTLETRWIDGELPAGTAPVRPRTPRSPWHSPWWAAAAAVLAVGLAASVFTRPVPSGRGTARDSGAFATHFLRGVERGEDGATSFAAPPSGDPMRLFVEVDLPPASFPLELTIADADGRTVHREPGIDVDRLLEGLYLYVECAADDCPAGAAYTVTIAPADRTVDSLRFGFAIAPAPDPVD